MSLRVGHGRPGCVGFWWPRGGISLLVFFARARPTVCTRHCCAIYLFTSTLRTTLTDRPYIKTGRFRPNEALARPKRPAPFIRSSIFVHGYTAATEPLPPPLQINKTKAILIRRCWILFPSSSCSQSTAAMTTVIPRPRSMVRITSIYRLIFFMLPWLTYTFFLRDSFWAMSSLELLLSRT